LSKVEFYLPCLVFTHCQLYVVVYRVNSKKWLKILILDEDENVAPSITNEVYEETFDFFYLKHYVTS